MKSHRATAKSTPFTVSKDEWDTKEDTGKSMNNYCMHCNTPKGTWPAIATSNSEISSPGLARISGLLMDSLIMFNKFLIS